jgi:hypothetical protein
VNWRNGKCEWDGKVDRTVEFDDFVMVPNGDFVIQKDGKYGVLDKRGKTKLQPVYHQIEVGKGEYLIRINRNYQIYRADGTFLNLPYKHVEQSDWNSDVLWVTDYVNGQAKAGVIDWQGNVLIPLKYVHLAEEFENGILCFNWSDIEPIDICPTSGLNESGDFYYKGKFLRTATIVHLENDLIEYCVTDFHKGNDVESDEGYYLCGLMDTLGKDFFVPSYGSISSTREKGVFEVHYSESSSFVDLSGKTIVEPVLNIYDVQWLGNGLYATNALYDDNINEEGFYVMDATSGNRFIEYPVYEVISLWPDFRYFLVRGEYYCEVFDSRSKKSVSRIDILKFEQSCPYIGQYGTIDSAPNWIYIANDLSSALEPSEGLSRPIPDGGLKKSNPYIIQYVDGNLVLIDRLTGLIHAHYPKSCYQNDLGRYICINQNGKNTIVDANNKELNVNGDIENAGPISDSKFFYQVSKNGNKETFIYDSEKNKNVMQFPGECYGMDAYPHFYRIGSTPQFFIFEDGQLLKD